MWKLCAGSPGGILINGGRGIPGSIGKGGGPPGISPNGGGIEGIEATPSSRTTRW
jgi:hypothetical protein